MYQNYNYYPPQTNQVSQQQTAFQTPAYLRQAPPQIGLRGRPVSSLEEVRATSIDFDGSVFYFPDLANKRIYTKQINIDGTATTQMYELREMPMQNENQVVQIPLEQFVTKDEFERALAQLRQSLVDQTEPEQKPKTEILAF